MKKQKESVIIRFGTNIHLEVLRTIFTGCSTILQLLILLHLFGVLQ